MSHPWFNNNGFNNKNCQLDSIYNERAGPRNFSSEDRKHHHQVLSASSSTNVPHYTQASQLYPMRPSLDIETFYQNKKPQHQSQNQPNYYSNMKYTSQPSNRDINYSNQPSSARYKSNQSSSAVVIPVVHLGNSSNSNSPACNSPGYQVGGGSEIGSPTSNHYSNIRRKLSSTSTVSSNNLDQEDVETLTNILLQSIDSRGGGGQTPQGNSSSLTYHSGPGTPTHDLMNQKRSNPSSVAINSRINRLQQQYQGTSTCSGRGSPLTSSNGASISNNNNPGTPNTNSPSGSISSGIDNLTPNINNNSSNSSNGNQNVCFRCHRYLILPDDKSINSSSNLANNPGIVTINGALSARLHVACFTCYRCQTPLKPDSYYHTLRRLLCSSCVRDGALETCYTCRRPIGDRVIRALGLPYHPSCFICCICNQRLESCPFTVDVHGKPHCLNDFHKKYAPKCTACGKPITPEQGSQEARRVVDGDNNYHLDCFTRLNNSDTTALPGIKSSLIGTLA